MWQISSPNRSPKPDKRVIPLSNVPCQSMHNITQSTVNTNLKSMISSSVETEICPTYTCISPLASSFYNQNIKYDCICTKAR